MNCDVLSICYWWSVCFMLDALSVCTSQKNNQSLGQSLSQTRDVNKTEMSRRFCSFHVLQVSLVNPGCPYTKRATLFVGARVLAQCAQEDQKHDATIGTGHTAPSARGNEIDVLICMDRYWLSCEVLACVFDKTASSAWTWASFRVLNLERLTSKP